MQTTLVTYEEKVVPTLEALKKVVSEKRDQGKNIVLTSGTFDILHVGHGRYLSLAKSQGEVLVVGCDSDAKVKARKGPHRPVVHEAERAEMLSYLAAVDFIYMKPVDDKRWALIKAVLPDVLITSERSEYSPADLEELKQYCGQVVVLESQAETSTTARIRSMIVSSVAPLENKFAQLEKLTDQIRKELAKIRGG